MTQGRIQRLENGCFFRLGPTWEIVAGDLEIRGDRIHSFGERLPPPGPAAEVIDLEGAWVLPGFVQSHLHLCQTLFRGLAEGLPLDRWLRERIWPLESAHTAESVAASARLGIAELIASGTTSVLDMGTVHHTDRIARAIDETGFAGVIGKAMMDTGEGVPEGLLETTDASVGGSVDLARAWDGAAGGRIRVALAPRFVLSVTRKAWRRIREIQQGRGLRIHTHACETPWENRVSRQTLGRTPIAFFRSQRLLGPRMTLAHCVWLGQREETWLAESGTRVAHCPSSNQKLGSGLADVPRLKSAGIAVGIGCDGAACSNALDVFEEMRRAILTASVRSGPGSLTARDVLGMATAGSAAGLGWDKEIGVLEPGRRADLVVLRAWDDPEEHGDPHETIVQEGSPERVMKVYVGGRLLYDDGRFTTLNIEEVVEEAREERRKLLTRLGWNPDALPLRGFVRTTPRWTTLGRDPATGAKP